MRFIYLTDTHLGCDETGYLVQPRYLGHERVMFGGLAQWIKQNDVAFVVHGGDLTDHGSAPEIEQSTSLCELLGVPVYLCLGNHDLAQPESMRLWRDSALWRGGDTDGYSIEAGGVTLVVTNHHWHTHVDHRWMSDVPQSPRLDDRQEHTLRMHLRQAKGPVIAVTHAPLNPVPIPRPGGDQSFHPPHGPYLSTWQRIAADHPNLRLIMCGHNHANSQQDHGSFISCTTASFAEVPAQLRLVEVNDSQIDVRTVALAEALCLSTTVHLENAWCAGVPESQVFSLNI